MLLFLSDRVKMITVFSSQEAVFQVSVNNDIVYCEVKTLLLVGNIAPELGNQNY